MVKVKWHKKIAAVVIVSLLWSGWVNLLLPNQNAVFARDDVRWETVGSAGFSEVVVGGEPIIATVSLDVYADVPYVAYADESKDGKLVVQKYNGLDWEYVGDGDGISDTEALGITLILDQETPYVAYVEQQESGPAKVFVKTYNGTTWESLGSYVGFTRNSATSLSIYEGTPYVAFADPNYFRVTAYRFGDSGWDYLGSSGLRTVNSVSIDVYGGTPYVAATSTTAQAIVAKRDGSTWEPLGQASLSSIPSDRVVMKLDNGTPYVAYLNARATVTEFNDGEWSPVGSAAFSPDGSYTAFDIDEGIPYFGFMDKSTGKATLMTFDGSEWKTVGPAGFSEGGASNLALAIDGASAYVAYRDQAQDNKMTVKKYDIHQIAELADQKLADLTEGYAPGSQESRTIAVQRAFSGKLDHLTVRLTGDDADRFTVTQPIATTLDNAVPETTFTVQAKDALASGTYTATVVVEADHAEAEEFEVTQVIRPQAAVPEATPAGGEVEPGTKVALTTETPGAAIHYTTDGSKPTTSSPVYTEPLGITTDTTIKAIAVNSGMTDSEVMSEHYTIRPQAAVPEATPAGGEVEPGTEVALTTDTPGAAIHYTTDDSKPSTSSPVYTEPLGITTDTTIKAIAVKAGMTDSEEMIEHYTIRPQAAVPEATPAGGEVEAGTEVTLTTATSGAAIHYTTDGSKPTTSSPVYTEPLAITTETTIKAIAVKAGMTDSEEMSERYTIRPLSAPENLVAKAGDRSVTLGWDYSTAETVTYSVYQYEGSSDPEDSNLWTLVESNITDSLYTVDGLMNGTVYRFTVKAVNAGGSSPFSISVTATPKANSSETEKNDSDDGGQSSYYDLSEAVVTGAYDNDFQIELTGSFHPGQYPELIVEQADVPAADSGQWRLSSGYEVSAYRKLSGQEEVKATVKVKLHSDPDLLPPGYEPRLFLYDLRSGKWEDLGGELHSDYIVAHSDRLGLFASFLTTSYDETASDKFNDTDGHWATPWLRLGASLGLASGYPDGSFRPGQEVSRLEFVSMLVRFTGKKMPDRIEVAASGPQLLEDWSDMPEWGAAYAIAAMRDGIVNGYPDGTFRPEARISRAEMVVMIERALALPQADHKLLDVYNDRNKVPEWADSGFSALLAAGYIQGSGGEKLDPQAMTTRAETIRIIVEAYVDSLR